MTEEAETPLLGDELFVDEDFPANDDSLFKNGERPGYSPITGWKRPWEIVQNPQMFVQGASRADVLQGGLGDCWFLSACAAVAQGKHVKIKYDDGVEGAWVLNSYSDDECQNLITQVIPEGQVLCGEGYTGKVTFYFWRMGQWGKVEIDDRLPVNETGDLVYAKCKDENEYWLPLLEKAFAKYHGRYDLLDGGHLDEGILYLTGAVVKTFGAENRSLFRVMRDEFHAGSVILCGSIPIEDRNSGIVQSHAYTITGLASFMQGTRRIQLLRVRNPWGHKEWTGAWSDTDDTNWSDIDSTLKDLLLGPRDNIDANDGEAWMEYKDFRGYFQQVTVATILPEADGKKLCTSIGCWEQYFNAGGSQQHTESFAKNPQYLLTVNSSDDDYMRFPGDDDDDEEKEEIEKKKGKSAVRIEMIQELNRSKYGKLYQAGLAIYKTTDPSKRLSAEELTEKIGSETISTNSSVLRQEMLEPGHYVIVPYLQEPNLSREFFIRAHSNKPIKLEELRDTEKNTETWWESILRCNCFSCKTEDIRVNITVSGTVNL
ncbi:calpain-12 [Anabrus simplex]|uniref:calpain-12 n=1 Tax=Anabrus simplex TaxID=316456 RepID=UPI0035A31FFA